MKQLFEPFSIRHTQIKNRVVLPPMVVYAVMCLDEGTKVWPSVYHFFKGKWARNITREWND